MEANIDLANMYFEMLQNFQLLQEIPFYAANHNYCT